MKCEVCLGSGDSRVKGDKKCLLCNGSGELCDVCGEAVEEPGQNICDLCYVEQVAEQNEE